MTDASPGQAADRIPRTYLAAGALFLLLAVASEIVLAASFVRLQESADRYNSGTQVITLLADVQRETLKLSEAILIDQALDTPEVQLRRDLLANQLRVLREATDELVFLGESSLMELDEFHQALARIDNLRARPSTEAGVTAVLGELTMLDRAVRSTSSHEEVEFVRKLRAVEARTLIIKRALLGLTVLTLLLGVGLGVAVSERYRRLYARAYERLDDEVQVRRRREDQLEHQANQLVQYAAEMEAANEALRIADQTKNDFVSTVSHELRTPLTAIRGFSQTLLMRWELLSDEQRRDLITSIERQGGRQQRLIEDLLTVSRMLAGTLTAFPETLRLATVVANCVEAVGVEVDLRIDEDLQAHADADHVAQVLNNLLTNAGKYGAGPIVVAGTLREGRAELSVEDRGHGVPPEFVDRLFDRFEQASTGDRRTSAGLGLGLAISRDLCELNGGSLAYERARHGGARFIVQLPRVLTSTSVGDPAAGQRSDESSEA